MHQNYFSKLYPLKLTTYEYDDVNKVYGKTEVVAAIKRTLQHYNIAPNASELEQENTIFIVSNVITDGAYLQARDSENEALVESTFKRELDAGPMFAGWELDPSHQIETIRKHINKK